MLKIVLAQINAHTGNISANSKKIIAAIEQAKKEYQADLVIFPESVLSGYPPEDLLLRQDFIEEIKQWTTNLKIIELGGSVQEWSRPEHEAFTSQRIPTTIQVHNILYR